MAHGAGGKQTSELIDQVFKAHFANHDLTADDAAVLIPPAGKMAVSTDGFIVSPAFFPGGNIGKLSICGTVNDLACMGAKPLYLTCAFVIEEGFPMEKLEQIAEAMAKTAKEAGVRIVSGDTKVAGKGQVDGVFITTTGMGEIQEGVQVGGELAKPGDAIIVTGDIGRHGCTILLEREDFGIDANVTSDCAPLWGTVKAVMDTTHNLHVIRDATRGGVGTVLYEIAGQSNVGIRLDAAAVPVASVSSSLPSAVASLLSLSCVVSDFCVLSVFCAHHPLTGCCNSMTPASRAAIIFFFICMSIPYNITSKTIGTTIASTSITAIIPATICLLFFFHIFIFHSPLYAPVPGNNRIDFPGCLIFR